MIFILQIIMNRIDTFLADNSNGIDHMPINVNTWYEIGYICLHFTKAICDIMSVAKNINIISSSMDSWFLCFLCILACSRLHFPSGASLSHCTLSQLIDLFGCWRWPWPWPPYMSLIPAISSLPSWFGLRFRSATFSFFISCCPFFDWSETVSRIHFNVHSV